jgi:hypothetical protein
MWAAMVDERRRKVLVYQQPTTMQGSPTRVLSSEMFILNGKHHYLWEIIGIDSDDTDRHYVTYIAHGVNNRGWVNIVVPRKWSDVEEDVEEEK